MRAAQFRLDCLPEMVWSGYTDGETWNGFACPWLTFMESLRLQRALEEMANREGLEADQIDLDWQPQDFRRGQLEDGNTVYAIGAREWTWEEIEGEAA